VLATRNATRKATPKATPKATRKAAPKAKPAAPARTPPAAGGPVTQAVRTLQIDAAQIAYAALGRGITWAVLDTGVDGAHPHFGADTLSEVWDCTGRGAPTRIAPADARDPHGHGTHVAGLVAGAPEDPARPNPACAPAAKLVVYKVLDDAGVGEDAWIIKALDHIERRNSGHSGIQVHGINLSLGGDFDASVYGCGYTPVCAELRRQWRGGVLVVVAAGNEGISEVMGPEAEFPLHRTMSIGDPANLEEAIAVGSVNGDKPTLYGVSAFSSRGPTADGRCKPDVVAPGERVLSCNASRDPRDAGSAYIEDSGTSMAAPMVSGLLASYLSVRREFIGRPDEAKQCLLRHCTDLARDRYAQGHGLPNLMRMLLGGGG
jgi:subtilisin family serine protease